MSRPTPEAADIFRECGAQYRKIHGSSMSREQHRAMRVIEVCRTEYLGGHIDVCDHCGKERPSYNSCLMGSIWLWGVPGEKEEFGGLFDAFGVRFCSP
jgi:hypothetical protein